MSDIRPEILAPVGGKEQLLAAVRCNADAVYFGLQNFNARRNADNFSGEDLPNTIKYCHQHNVKVYITVNTIVLDSEIGQMTECVDRAVSCGADALIIQDMAVAAYVKSAYPGFPMYASTQMAVHNAAGALALKDYGFSRIVLARELSEDEIKRIIDETGIEVEVFVHGAHCMSVSGNCYLSAMIGERSGNRGLCAQACRLDWHAGDMDHCLSLKDLSYVNSINKLAEIGVCSFKIEGRMKRPEYVAAAVTACRDVLDGRTPDMDTLRSVFSRSGFTDGYLKGKRDKDMFGYRTKDDVVSAASVLDDLAKLYEEDKPLKKIDMFFMAREAVPAVLNVSCEGVSAKIEGPVPEAAIKLELTEDYVKKSLSKLGGTIYSLGKFKAVTDPGLMLPASVLNKMRRDAVEALDKKEVIAEKCGGLEALDIYEAPGEAEYRFRFEKASQIFDAPGTIILPLSELEGDPGLLEKYGERLFAELPALIYPEQEENVAKKLRKLAGAGLKHAFCENIGAVKIAQDCGLSIHLGPCMNVINSYAAREYEKLGIKDICMSFEMSFADFRRLSCAVPRGAIVYGYLPLMKLRNCPAKAAIGCGLCKQSTYLTDRMGERFRIDCRGDYSELMNCVPLYVGDKSVPCMDFQLFYFTKETPAEAEKLYKAYLSKESLPERKTGGLYYRRLL